ncbi:MULTISPECIES: CorA family divalent cation transporter [Pseudomonas]|uniref:CorA family divalent cation transporter n=1 Tax=Pseudomonas TaxID=286 RepID=UPI000854514B|nr:MULTISPECIES: CorA family divalent cation transporter [Pseudomonas]MAB96715.1 zinc transporter ZntB [Pseudomonadaceae bacterium]NRH29910.1 zinc transporter ZntB [Pseudomonas sp. MS19]OEO25459.1 CmaX protein [Pseudomonas sp. J237]
MNADKASTVGLVHAYLLDGLGGGRPLEWEQVVSLQLEEKESLWLHWDRSHPDTQQWLRYESGLSQFSCDLLLEENTRPRLLTLPDNELLLFLRGLNLNPGAEPEDMVSLRIFADARRAISLRLRPLRATESVIADLHAGKGPKTSSELLLAMADYLTDKVELLVTELSEEVDEQEDLLDNDPAFTPDHGLLLQARRRAANLRRFLAPQREIFAQLARNQQPWFVEDDSDYWNELHNRLTRYLEELDLNRERLSLLLEAESRQMDIRMNRIMYRFGIITGVFLPMSFLTGLLGINVGGIPWADNHYGFAIACSIMAVLAVGQWWLFRRLKWV